MNKRITSTALSLVLALTMSAQYTLADWKIKDFNPNCELNLNVNEYKLDGYHPLVYADWQKCWTVKAELKCGTLGTEQVFVCKEGKASHLIGKNSLNGDISLGYDNTAHRFFVEVIDKDENPHRLWAGGEVQKDKWYEVEALSMYDEKKKSSTVTLIVDGSSASLTYQHWSSPHRCREYE